MNRRPLLLSVAVVVAGLVHSSGASFAGPGYYSVAEIGGVWWFVDPQGKPFYSIGVSDIGPGTSRDTYDSKRPSYAAFRNYDSTEKWAEDTLKRLQDWNFNTIGSWADESLTKGPLPYAVVLHFGSGYVPWNDLFSSKFEDEIELLARTLVAPRGTDRNLLGWFSDNELTWYPDEIFRYHLAQPPNSTTRSKLLEILTDYYKGDFSSLEADFEAIGAKNFEELAKGGELRLRPNCDGSKVIGRFTAAVAERYYKVVHDAIRRYDSNHLILGDRYAWHCPEAVAKAAAPYVDVVSTNLDWPEATDGYLPCGYLRNLHRLTGRPVLITEYYVAAQENRSGNKNTSATFLTVATQEERAIAFQNRLRLLAGQPYVVGAHWFRFADEPPHGRPKDGEDYNFGLVDIDNRPYEALTSAMTRLNANVPDIHVASKNTTIPPDAQIAIPLVRNHASELHEHLVQARPLPTGDLFPLYDLLAAWNPDKLYFVALVCHFSEREMYSAAGPLEDHELELAITGQSMNSPVRVRFGGKAGASANVETVECWLSSNGLRHTLVVGLPADLLGTPVLKHGDPLKFRLTLDDLLDKQTQSWETNCILAEETTGDTASASSPKNVE